MNVGSRKQRSVFSGAAQDTRYAIRTLRKGGAFTITAVLSLALCIGAISAIFTALDAVLWRPLPVADPDKLVNLKIMGPNSTDLQDLPAALIWRLQEAGIFAGVTMFSSDGVSFVYGNDRAERVISEVVSPDYFDFVGIPTFLGEPFTSDVRQGKWAAQTVLSYTFWQRRFGGDPRVIGQTVHLNTYPFTIVGVSPPGFF